MSDKIKTVCQNLFKEIRANHINQLPLIDKWVDANTDQSNLALFLTKGDDEDRKELCVLLKKAIDNKDFSAFDPDAKPPAEDDKANDAAEESEPEEKKEESKEEKSEPEPEPQTEPKKEQQKSEPKADKAEDKPKEDPKGEPAKTEPEPKDEPKGTTLDSMVATIAGAVFHQKISGFIPKIVDKVIEKLGGTPKGESTISEERINEIVDERINERFKKILGE